MKRDESVTGNNSVDDDDNALSAKLEDAVIPEPQRIFNAQKTHKVIKTH
jgi:hypothetical protein